MSLNARERAERHIGYPRPDGEPDQMDAAVLELKAIAAEFHTQSAAMKATKVDGEGGVVERNNQRAMKRGSHLRHRGDRLSELAEHVSRAAGDIRREQDRWDRKLKGYMDADRI